MSKDLIIFDGSNFYHGAKRLSPRSHLTDFNYRGLAEEIANNKNIEIEYCVGEIRYQENDRKSFKLYANQQALFYNLEMQKIEIFGNTLCHRLRIVMLKKIIAVEMVAELNPRFALN